MVTKKDTTKIIIAMLLSVVTIGLSTNVSAKKRGATILSTHKLSKTTNKAVSGYLYTTAHLTKKAHNADNYPRTTFYTYKSATVRKANGNKAVYYYVKNGNGKVRGWIWRGNLVQTFNFAKQKADLRRITSLIKSISTKNREGLIKLLEAVDKHATISSVVSDLTGLANKVDNSADAAKIREIAKIIKEDGTKMVQLVQSGIDKLYQTTKNIHEINNQIYDVIQSILNILP
ncbi:D-alanyl-D-alanine carboxypeptidase [Lentilactobacillus sp. Marseille-Q4993]|uniref:D-alanyl-D-alanine carboxypeptidase n=1 Tax=Lentilactobacillus sp. Marseille-Q4993 TaxID=3039492 RepID=UPI0024BD38C8|nr:D-alanyl-D-alanine carboxypeptidase [Lentilactobacillus sp. Marseille-Q4993]